MAETTHPATTSSGRIVRALKDAGLAALIALGIAAPLIGLRTNDSGAGGLIHNWTGVAWAVAIVFAARLAYSLFLRESMRIVRPPRLGGGQVGAVLSRSTLILGPLLLLVAALLPLLPFADRRIMDMAILILTYIMLGWGLNVVVGLAGLLDLGYVAFYAVGAYSYALLAQHFDWGFWVCLPIAGMLAAMWGLILGFPVLRLRGDYLAIVTLAFGEIIRIVLLNWASFTGGPNGLYGVPRPSFFGLEFSRDGGFAEYFGLEYTPMHRIIFLYYVILVLALITNYVTLRLRRLPVGRAWEAMREDEIACRALGLNTTNTKLTAFAIGAGFAGFAGSFFATRQGFISPESFVFMESALVLSIVVLGGLGSQVGVVIAAVVMIGGIEALRSLDFLKQVFGEDFDPAQYRMLLFGLAMVMIMVWRPRGLISTREPSIRLNPESGTRTPEAPSPQRQAEEAAS